MSKKAKKPEKNAVNPEDSTTEEEGAVLSNLPLFIHAQYIKDLSFENPRAPAVLKETPTDPKTDVNFTMSARSLPEQERLYEVSLGIELAAISGDETVFLIDLQYGAIVSIQESVPEEKIHPMLLIRVPTFLFPFIRQLVANVTQNGGFAPLLLAPVNFRKLYIDRYGDGTENTDDSDIPAKAKA